LQIESARGLASLSELAALALPDVRLALGNLDLSVDLDCDPSSETITSAAISIVVASRTGGLPGPIDGVTPQTADAQIVRGSARAARALGFTGKLCIHPAQLRPTLEGLKPTAEKVDWARSVVASTSRGDGARALGGEMIDAPVVARAERILRESGEA
jgi:citrate lyase subunit beta/citryl-CoA lyase